MLNTLFGKSEMEKTLGDRRLDDRIKLKENAIISEAFGVFTVTQILASPLQLKYGFYHTKF
jgi:hypothetical protein